MMSSTLPRLPHQLLMPRTCTSFSLLHKCTMLHQRLHKLYLNPAIRQMQTGSQRGKPFPSRCLRMRAASIKYESIPKARTMSTSLLSPVTDAVKPLLLSRLCSVIKSQQCVQVSQYVSRMRHLEKLKENDELCKEAMRTGQYAVFYDLKALVCMDEESARMKLAWRTANEMEEILALSGGLSLTDAVLLNSTSQNPPDQPAKFALNIPKGDETTQPLLEKYLKAQALGIRRAMFGVGRVDITDLLQAYAVLQWHTLQAFCSKCGGTNETNLSGSRRICTSCSEIHYPTMKPIVITLVVDGERCLVARQPQFPQGMYSALAGFCDMGETLEDAVRREVAEEVGLEVDGITYSSSQHWPLPTSGLMLGCYANLKADSVGEMSVDTNELEDAQWLSREEVRSILESRGQGSMWLPPRQAIAHHLIRGWAFNNAIHI